VDEAGAPSVEDLELALRSRTVIAAAVGMVMERYGLSYERAFAYLRRLSQDQNVKLRLVAERTVARGVGSTTAEVLDEHSG
jgi:AmiR/NasT family two-component response regulator